MRVRVAVSCHDSGEAMRDGENGTRREFTSNAALNEVVGFDVHTRRRFVENQNRCLTQQRTTHTNQLTFADRQIVSARQHEIELSRQRMDLRLHIDE